MYAFLWLVFILLSLLLRFGIVRPSRYLVAITKISLATLAQNLSSNLESLQLNVLFLPKPFVRGRLQIVMLHPRDMGGERDIYICI